MVPDIIYTHDEAAFMIELFENVLNRYHIIVPSPEDDERGAGNSAVLYGSTYYDLLDSVEQHLLDVLDRHTAAVEIIQGEFSGTA